MGTKSTLSNTCYLQVLSSQRHLCPMTFNNDIQAALKSRHRLSCGVPLKPKNCLVRVLLMICAVETLCGEYMICQQFHDVGVLKNPLLLKTAEDSKPIERLKVHQTPSMKFVRCF